MKRIALAAASALLMLGSAQAQQASPWYGELGYSFLQVENNVPAFDANPHAIRGIAGYNFHPFLAAEGMLALGVKDDSDRGVNAKVRNAWGLFVKPRYAFGNIEAFARLGWVRTKLRLSGPGGSDSDSDSDFAWGAGVNYNFNPRTYGGVDYLRLYNDGGTRIDGWTLSVGFRF